MEYDLCLESFNDLDDAIAEALKYDNTEVYIIDLTSFETVWEKPNG